jgi:hypothetical protein
MSYFTAFAAFAAVVSAGVSIYSANEQSSAQAAMAEYNRMAAEQNASWQRLAGERAAQADQFNAQIAGFNAEQQKQQAQFSNSVQTAQIAQQRAQMEQSTQVANWQNEQNRVQGELNTQVANFKNDQDLQQSKFQNQASNYANEQLRQNANFNDMQADLQRNSATTLLDQAKFQNQASNYANEQLKQNASFNDMQADLQRNSATMLRQQAELEAKQSRDQVDRIRAEKDRILGLQKSKYAAGGVTSEGSPLAVLADTANEFDITVSNAKQIATFEYNKKRYEAGVIDHNAKVTNFESGRMRDQAEINKGIGEYEMMSAEQKASVIDYNAKVTNFESGQMRDQADINTLIGAYEMMSSGLKAGVNRSLIAFEDIGQKNAGVLDSSLIASQANSMRNEFDANGRMLQFNLNQNLFESGMNASAAKMQFNDAKFAEEAAGAGYRIALRQAAIEQRAGISQSRGTMMAGYGSALSNISQAGYYGSQSFSSTGSTKPKTTTVKPVPVPA